VAGRTAAIVAFATLLRLSGLGPFSDVLEAVRQEDRVLVHDAYRRAIVKCPSKARIPDEAFLSSNHEPPRQVELPCLSAHGNSFAHVGPSWSGFAQIHYHFIFGDSYSCVGYRAPAKYPQPTLSEPLGVEFPGETSCEAENWVGSMVSTYKVSKAIAFCYARPGSRVESLKPQVRKDFMDYAALKGEGATWSYSTALFCTWVGQNDIASRFLDSPKAMKVLFELQNDLYDAGARNFLFLNSIPLDRAPVASLVSRGLKERIAAWNASLEASIQEFQRRHEPDICVLYYDAHFLFSDMLDFPSKYSIASAGKGDFWIDDVHPTSAVHRNLAKDIRAFLDKIMPHQGEKPP